MQCQGATFNLTPYAQFADSRKHPWEDYYDEPQYNITDATGKMVPTYVTVKNYPGKTGMMIEHMSLMELMVILLEM